MLSKQDLILTWRSKQDFFSLNFPIVAQNIFINPRLSQNGRRNQDTITIPRRHRT